MHGDFQDWVDEVVHPDLVNSVKLGVNRRTGRLFSIEHIGRGRMRMLVMDGAPGRSPAVVCRIDNVGSTAAWADDSNWIFYTKLDLTRDSLVGFRWLGVSFRWYCGVGGLVVGH